MRWRGRHGRHDSRPRRQSAALRLGGRGRPARRCHRLARHLIPISKVNTSPTSDKTPIVIG
jgi:hypothetical protein